MSFLCLKTFQFDIRRYRKGWPGGRGGHVLQIFQSHWIFGNFNVLSENFQTSCVGKDKGFEFNWKIFELGPPTLQVS